MGDFVTTVFPACMRGTNSLDGSLIPWTSDARDIIAGMQHTQIVLDERFAAAPEHEEALVGLDEIDLDPWNWSGPSGSGLNVHASAKQAIQHTTAELQ